MLLFAGMPAYAWEKGEPQSLYIEFAERLANGRCPRVITQPIGKISFVVAAKKSPDFNSLILISDKQWTYISQPPRFDEARESGNLCMSTRFSGHNFSRDGYDLPLDVPPQLQGTSFFRGLCVTVRGRATRFIPSSRSDCCKQGCNRGMPAYISGSGKTAARVSDLGKDTKPVAKPVSAPDKAKKPLRWEKLRACCAYGSCKVVTEPQCGLANGKWHPDLISCPKDLCAPKIDTTSCAGLLGSWHQGNTIYTLEPTGVLKIGPDAKPGNWSCISVTGNPRAVINTGPFSATIRLVRQGGDDFFCLEGEEFSERRCARRGKPMINVLSASYGLHRCKTFKPPGGRPNTVSEGNATQDIKSECDGRSFCRYTVHWKVIGDPAFACQKDYQVKWNCYPGGKAKGPIHVCKTGCEAGYGTKVTLSCP